MDVSRKTTVCVWHNQPIINPPFGTGVSAGGAAELIGGIATATAAGDVRARISTVIDARRRTIRLYANIDGLYVSCTYTLGSQISVIFNFDQKNIEQNWIIDHCEESI